MERAPGALHVLVMELVEGEDLAERLLRGAIPVREAMEMALQIATALEAAHEKSIVHRDLKPANVRVTPQAAVKVLDYGLAKALYPALASGGDAGRHRHLLPRGQPSCTNRSTGRRFRALTAACAPGARGETAALPRDRANRYP